MCDDGVSRSNACPQYLFSRQLLLLILSIVVFWTAGCQSHKGKTSGIAVTEKITPQPVRVGRSTVEIQLSDALHRPVSGASVRVEGDMAHPGMTPVFADAIQSKPGSYQAQFDFSMAGDWIILLHIGLPDGRKVEHQFQVPGVLPN